MATHDVPVEYTHELAEEICQRLAEGETLGSICSDLKANDPQCLGIEPHKVRKWTRQYENFQTMYQQALIDGAEALLDQMHDIAENPTVTEVITEKWSGGRNPKLLERTVRIVDGLERDKLRILVRQHRARMQSPTVQAIEKKTLSVAGDPDGAPVAVEIRGGLPPLPHQVANPVPIAAPEDPPA